MNHPGKNPDRSPSIRSKMVSNIPSQSKLPPISNISQYSPNTLSGNIERQHQAELRITNELSRYVLHHGEEFKEMLEPRDQVLQHRFDFSLKIDNRKEPWEGSPQEEQLLGNIKHFLVQSTSNVASAAFKFLCKGELQQSEAKEYASKNMLLNVQAILRQSLNALDQGLRSRVREGELQEIKENVVVEVDNMLDGILSNLADYYPQALPTGGTPRMKEVIKEINRVEDQENDLIFANNIKLNDFKDEQGNYTRFIMEVINTAIGVTQNNDDHKERTIKDIFTQFSQNLFWSCQQPSYQNLIASSLNQATNVQDQTSDVVKEDIVMYFDSILEREPPQQSRKQVQTKNHSSGKTVNLKELLIRSQKGLQELRRDKKHGIGQKIPGHVREFRREQLQRNQFTARHSSILRILTKWSEYLQQIFINCEEQIWGRKYKYKNGDNQLPMYSLAQQNHILESLKGEYEEVKRKKQVLLQNNYKHIAHILAQGREGGLTSSNVNRYDQTRGVASKINAVLTSLMVNYTSVLIHHLVKVGEERNTTILPNLVVFRVSDLLRSKLQCSESSFITLLKTLYLLDQSESMKGKFKLVRIKNKLDDPANNIMINYLLMGKVQCQLQLSIQEPKGKQKNYYAFSHFVYELTRGKFGAIAECAIMVSQLDPMVSASKGPYYQQKPGRKLALSRKKISKRQDVQQQDRKMDECVQFKKNIQASIFTCFQCRKLMLNESRVLFIEEGNENRCNRCIANAESPELQIRDDDFRKMVTRGLKQGYLQRMNYKQLANVQGEFTYYLIEFKNSGVYFMVALRSDREFKTFFVHFDMGEIQNMVSDKIDFSQLNYTDVTKNISKGDSSSLLLFGSKSFSSFLKVLDPSFNQDAFEGIQICGKMAIFIQAFREYRMEKSLIKSIKFGTEVISNTYNVKQWKILDTIGHELFYPQKEEKTSLSYTKYKQLTPKFKELKVINVELPSLPKWLHQCKDLRVLMLDANQIEEVFQEGLPPKLKFISLSNNNIKKASLTSPQLVQINLDQNKLKRIELADMQKLTHLIMEQNLLTNFSLKNCPNLLTLSLASNKLSKKLKMPSLPQLKALNLNQNQLEELDLCNLPNLEEAYLQKNKIRIVNLSGLGKLDRLGLAYNKLKGVDLSQNKKLFYLNLAANLIQRLELEGLQVLKQLLLDANQLTKFKMTGHPVLKQLRLSQNQKLSQVELTNMEQLEMVNLLQTSLTLLKIIDLPRLEELNLDDCAKDLQHLTLKNLSNLSGFSIRETSLARIDLSECPSLQRATITSAPNSKMEVVLPSSLKVMAINDNNILENYDFKHLVHLEEIVAEGVIDRAKIKNLNKKCIIRRPDE